MFRLFLIGLISGTALLSSQITVSQTLEAPKETVSDDGPRQVILIIGDGMDDQQITIARNYLAGAAGRLELDKMPLRSTSQILTIEDKVNGKHLYVADSANTGTAMATGVVTSRGRISTSAGSDTDIPTIVEIAHAAGYRTLFLCDRFEIARELAHGHRTTFPHVPRLPPSFLPAFALLPRPLGTVVTSEPTKRHGCDDRRVCARNCLRVSIFPLVIFEAAPGTSARCAMCA